MPSIHKPNLVAAGVRRYLLSFGMSVLPCSGMRVQLLRLCGVSIGKGCYVGFNVMPDTNYPYMINIGNDVTISHGCSLITHTQTPASAAKLSTYFNKVDKIQIHDGAWIGMHSVILPGADIQQDCMIGAGSVVPSMTTLPNSVYAGNPIKFKKHIGLQ